MICELCEEYSYKTYRVIYLWEGNRLVRRSVCLACAEKHKAADMSKEVHTRKIEMSVEQDG